MNYNNRKRNTPIATLIKNYINKNSGKVSDSRNEIQRRFDCLDWKDQKKIVLAFLESGKTDRQWAYSKALDFWDKSFEPKINELWEQLHEDKCSWVVIRHFPVKYLSQNINKFTGERDYYFICLRLAEDKDYVIEKDKLSLTDYPAVLYHTGRSIDVEEAENLLYESVHGICLDCDPIFDLDRYADTSKGSIISPICFKAVSLPLYYLRKLGHLQIVWQFEEWNKRVQEAILNSPEFKAICKLDLIRYEYVAAAVCVAKKYAYLALDDKYKKPSDPDVESFLEPKEWYVEPMRKESVPEPTVPEPFAPDPSGPTVLKEMIAQNPAIGKLVGRMGLDIKR